MKKALSILILLCFLFTSIMGPNPVLAEDIRLPAPGMMVHLSPEFNPPILKGIKVHPDNPFRFDFILDQGDSLSKRMSSPNVSIGDPQQEQTPYGLKQEATKLIKYFLASLTIPEKELWVNLSPYEKDRIIPKSFGLTEMGRDLLAEDYMLKQITASLIYPEDVIGKKFWKRVYEQTAKKFGSTNIPVNTFNKVWIVPEKAVVYENAKAGTAYVVESKLKVMLEEDYLAVQKNQSRLGGQPGDMFKPEQQRTCPQADCQPSDGLKTKASQGANFTQSNDINTLGSQIVREIIIPELTKEVNENKNFAQLRQVYNSLILATWYKKKIKDSILSQIYANKNKVAGIKYTESVIARNPKGDAAISETEKIYQRYLKAFKKGAYNYIKEEADPVTLQTIPRKYFSGGLDLAMTTPKFGPPALEISTNQAQLSDLGDKAVLVSVNITPVGNDYAMISTKGESILEEGKMLLELLETDIKLFIKSEGKLKSVNFNLPAMFKSFSNGYSGRPERRTILVALRGMISGELKRAAEAVNERKNFNPEGRVMAILESRDSILDSEDIEFLYRERFRTNEKITDVDGMCDILKSYYANPFFRGVFFRKLLERGVLDTKIFGSIAPIKITHLIFYLIAFSKRDELLDLENDKFLFGISNLSHAIASNTNNFIEAAQILNRTYNDVIRAYNFLIIDQKLPASEIEKSFSLNPRDLVYALSILGKFVQSGEGDAKIEKYLNGKKIDIAGILRDYPIPDHAMINQPSVKMDNEHRVSKLNWRDDSVIKEASLFYDSWGQIDKLVIVYGEKEGNLPEVEVPMAGSRKFRFSFVDGIPGVSIDDNGKKWLFSGYRMVEKREGEPDETSHVTIKSFGQKYLALESDNHMVMYYFLRLLKNVDRNIRLINFDLHSDIYPNYQRIRAVNLTNWVGLAWKKGYASTVTWVYPLWHSADHGDVEQAKKSGIFDQITNVVSDIRQDLYRKVLTFDFDYFRSSSIPAVYLASREEVDKKVLEIKGYVDSIKSDLIGVNFNSSALSNENYSPKESAAYIRNALISSLISVLGYPSQIKVSDPLSEKMPQIVHPELFDETKESAFANEEKEEAELLDKIYLASSKEFLRLMPDYPQGENFFRDHGSYFADGAIKKLPDFLSVSDLRNILNSFPADDRAMSSIASPNYSMANLKAGVLLPLDQIRFLFNDYFKIAAENQKANLNLDVTVNGRRFQIDSNGMREINPVTMSEIINAGPMKFGDYQKIRTASEYFMEGLENFPIELISKLGRPINLNLILDLDSREIGMEDAHYSHTPDVAKQIINIKALGVPRGKDLKGYREAINHEIIHYLALNLLSVEDYKEIMAALGFEWFIVDPENRQVIKVNPDNVTSMSEALNFIFAINYFLARKNGAEGSHFVYAPKEKISYLSKLGYINSPGRYFSLIEDDFGGGTAPHFFSSPDEVIAYVLSTAYHDTTMDEISTWSRFTYLEREKVIEIAQRNLLWAVVTRPDGKKVIRIYRPPPDDSDDPLHFTDQVINPAMVATRGGIDFTANKTPLEIKNASAGIKFHIDPAMLAQLQNAPGFTPIIINIQPMADIKVFLGLKEE
jgi:hypothetical protein